MNVFKNLALGAALAVGVGAAGATQIYTNSLQTVIDNLYVAGGTPIGAAPNVNTDQYAQDEQWAIGGSGGSVTTFVIQLAGLAGTHNFGIYDATDPTKKVSLFSGAVVGNPQTIVSILLDGSVIKNFADTGVDFAGNQFGYYLTAGSNTFYSQTSLNTDGQDHMVAYQGDGDNIQIGGYAAGPWGANEFIIAFEDLYGAYGQGSDRNFSDFVALVESVRGVPEPGTLALVGLTLAGLGVASRRRKNA